MPGVLTIIIMVYAVLIGVFGAPLWAVAAAGGFAVLWQMASTLYTAGAQSATPVAPEDRLWEDEPDPEPIPDTDLSPEEYRDILENG